MFFSRRLKHETTAFGAGYPLPQNFINGFVKISQCHGCAYSAVRRQNPGQLRSPSLTEKTAHNSFLPSFPFQIYTRTKVGLNKPMGVTNSSNLSQASLGPKCELSQRLNATEFFLLYLY